MTQQAPSTGIKIIVQNRKARHDYEVLSSLEAGIALVGSEVKALRQGKVNLQDSYATVEAGQVVLRNAHISHYEASNRLNHDPVRPRQLLLHRKEIRRLGLSTTQQGQTLVPLKLYFKRGVVKVELALARGKKQFDKRHTLAQRQAQRDVERALKDHR